MKRDEQNLFLLFVVVICACVSAVLSAILK